MALTVADAPVARTLADAKAAWRQSAAYRSRPKFVEQLVGMVALTVLTTGLPTEWFVVIDGNLYDAVNVGGPLVIVVFTGLIGTLLVFSMKRPAVMFYLLVCELLLLAFSALILFSTMWSVDFATSLRRSVALTLVTMMGIYFVARYSLEQLINRLSIVFFVAMVLNVVWVNALPQYGTAGEDFLGITTNRNTLGQQAVLGCLVMVFAMASRNHRILATIGFFGSAYLVFGTNSMTSLGSFVLLGGLLVVFSTFRARKQLFGAVVVSEIAAGLFGLLLATANLVFLTELLGRDITLTGRTILWLDLLEPISEKPVLGHGWEAFWGGWGSPAHEIWLQNTWFPPTAHNAPLEYLLALGGVGLALWAVMMVRGFWRSIHYLRDRPGLAGLFPIAIFSYAFLYSVTEAGVVRRGIDWMLVVVALVETKRFMDRNRSTLDGSKLAVARRENTRGKLAR
ncbi:MAG: O-antigen ligase family protein [Acidimicrobiales bacterium]|nr:O-antigen ligase family protein [Acidimicrobiales bacterium]